MATTFKCDQCGHVNQLGTIFCRSCGARMDLSKVHAGRGGRSMETAGSAVGRIVRLVIVLALLVALGLLCWPKPVAGDAPSTQGVRVVETKAKALRGALARGNEVAEEFSEADINAHLMARLVNPVKPEGRQLYLRDVRVNIQPGGATVWMRSDLGPLPVTYLVRFTMEKLTEREVAFIPHEVYVGHLTMIGPARERILQQVTSAFARLTEEQSLMQRVASVELIDGAVVLDTRR